MSFDTTRPLGIRAFIAISCLALCIASSACAGGEETAAVYALFDERAEVGCLTVDSFTQEHGKLAIADVMLVDRAGEPMAGAWVRGSFAGAEQMLEAMTDETGMVRFRNWISLGSANDSFGIDEVRFSVRDASMPARFVPASACLDRLAYHSGSDVTLSGTGSSSEDPQSGTGSSSEDPQSGTGSSSEAPQSGTGSSSEAPQSGTGSSSEDPKSGTGSSSEAPQSGTGSSSEDPQSGTGSSSEGTSI